MSWWARTVHPDRHMMAVWQSLARELGATYETQPSPRVCARTGTWTIVLDAFKFRLVRGSPTFTRLRAPFIQARRLDCVISDGGPWSFSEWTTWLMSQHLKSGDRLFDLQFFVTGVPADVVQNLLADPRSRELLLRHRGGNRLEISDAAGWFGTQLPAGIAELRGMCASGVDVVRLKGLVEVFGAVLARLAQVGVASTDDPGVELPA
jgi:hypothetical protein